MPPNHPTTRVLLLRHAETAAPDLFHGAESDVGLGTEGVEQARRVAVRIAAERPDIVDSSGMRRAAETARIIAAACGLSAGIRPDLHERRMGPLSGKPRGEGWASYESAKARWMVGDLDATHAGGESYASMRARAVASFRDLLAREVGRTSVVVAHGVINRVLLTSLVEGYSFADFDRVPIEFVGVHDLRWDGVTVRLDGYWPGVPNTVRPDHDRAGS